MIFLESAQTIVALGHQTFAEEETGKILGRELDVAGFGGILFIATAGKVAGGRLSFNVESSNDGKSWEPLGKTLEWEADDSGKLLLVEVWRQQTPFLRPVVRGCAGAELLGVTAIRYDGKNRPAVQDPQSVARAMVIR